MRIGIGLALTSPAGRGVVSSTAELPLTLWERTAYAGSPWNGTASAGSSGARSLTEATNPPAVGALLNARATADFDGVNDRLNGLALSNYASTPAGSAWVLYIADTSAAAAALAADDRGILCLENAGHLIMAHNNTGPRVALFDTGYRTIQLAHAATAVWTLLQMKWDGVNLYARVNSGAWTSTPCTGPSNLTFNIRAGLNNDTLFRFDGRIAEIGMSATAISDANYEVIRAGVNSYHGLAL